VIPARARSEATVKLIPLALAALVAWCALPSCSSAPADDPPADRALQDEALDDALRPMIDAVAAHTRGRRLGFPGFYHGPSGRDLPMSRYLSPRVVRALAERRVPVVERSDLDKLLDEQALVTSDLFTPEARERIGPLGGADLLLLCPAISPDQREYQVDWKLADVATGDIVASGLVALERRDLPLQYGGVLD